MPAKAGGVSVMPAKAGIQLFSKTLDASLRWHDKIGAGMTKLGLA